MALLNKIRRDTKKSSYYVWFLGAQESKGLRGPEYITPVLKNLIEREKIVEPFKITLQVSHKGLKIIQNLNSINSRPFPGKGDGKSEQKPNKNDVIKHFIPHHAVTCVLQEDDVVACILLLYNPVTRCPVHVHSYRCDSKETASLLTNQLTTLILRPENQKKMNEIESRLRAKGLLLPTVPRVNIPKRLNSSGSEGRSTTSPASESSGGSSGGGCQNERITNLYDSLAAELREKLGMGTDSKSIHAPILLPPRDYDTVHRQKGNLAGIEMRRCLNENIVGIKPNTEGLREPERKNLKGGPLGRILESSGGSSGIGSDHPPSPDQNGRYLDNQSTSDEEWAEGHPDDPIFLMAPDMSKHSTSSGNFDPEMSLPRAKRSGSSRMDSLADMKRRSSCSPIRTDSGCQINEDHSFRKRNTSPSMMGKKSSSSTRRRSKSSIHKDCAKCPDDEMLRKKGSCSCRNSLHSNDSIKYSDEESPKKSSNRRSSYRNSMDHMEDEESPKKKSSCARKNSDLEGNEYNKMSDEICEKKKTSCKTSNQDARGYVKDSVDNLGKKRNAQRDEHSSSSDDVRRTSENDLAVKKESSSNRNSSVDSKDHVRSSEEEDLVKKRNANFYRNLSLDKRNSLEDFSKKRDANFYKNSSKYFDASDYLKASDEDLTKKKNANFYRNSCLKEYFISSEESLDRKKPYRDSCLNPKNHLGSSEEDLKKKKAGDSNRNSYGRRANRSPSLDRRSISPGDGVDCRRNRSSSSFKEDKLPQDKSLSIENFRKRNEKGNMSPVGVVAPRRRISNESRTKGDDQFWDEDDSYKKRIPGYKEKAKYLDESFDQEDDCKSKRTDHNKMSAKEKKLRENTMKLSPQERFIDAKTKFQKLEKERLKEHDKSVEKKQSYPDEAPISPEIIKTRPCWGRGEESKGGKVQKPPLVRKNSFFDMYYTEDKFYEKDHGREDPSCDPEIKFRKKSGSSSKDRYFFQDGYRQDGRFDIRLKSDIVNKYKDDIDSDSLRKRRQSGEEKDYLEERRRRTKSDYTDDRDVKPRQKYKSPVRSHKRHSSPGRRRCMSTEEENYSEDDRHYNERKRYDRGSPPRNRYNDEDDSRRRYDEEKDQHKGSNKNLSRGQEKAPSVPYDKKQKSKYEMMENEKKLSSNALAKEFKTRSYQEKIDKTVEDKEVMCSNRDFDDRFWDEYPEERDVQMKNQYNLSVTDFKNNSRQLAKEFKRRSRGLTHDDEDGERKGSGYQNSKEKDRFCGSERESIRKSHIQSDDRYPENRPSRINQNDYDRMALESARMTYIQVDKMPARYRHSFVDNPIGLSIPTPSLGHEILQRTNSSVSSNRVGIAAVHPY